MLNTQLKVHTRIIVIMGQVVLLNYYIREKYKLYIYIYLNINFLRKNGIEFSIDINIQ